MAHGNILIKGSCCYYTDIIILIYYSSILRGNILAILTQGDSKHRRHPPAESVLGNLLTANLEAQDRNIKELHLNKKKEEHERSSLDVHYS